MYITGAKINYNNENYNSTKYENMKIRKYENTET
jgi:hypothetical protein